MSSRTASGRLPKRSRQLRSSSRVSARWVCSRSPRRLASSAEAVISSGVTLKGLQGAMVTTIRSPSWSRSYTAWVEARMVSSSSTTESGGRPPLLWPRSMEPRAMWARIPMVLAAEAMASNTESSPPGTM